MTILETTKTQDQHRAWPRTFFRQGSPVSKRNKSLRKPTVLFGATLQQNPTMIPKNLSKPREKRSGNEKFRQKRTRLRKIETEKDASITQQQKENPCYSVDISSGNRG